MIARRDVLKLAATLAATAGGPFAVSPEEAEALLAEPAGFDPGPGRGGIGSPDNLDPVQFAESIDGADAAPGRGLAKRRRGAAHYGRPARHRDRPGPTGVSGGGCPS